MAAFYEARGFPVQAIGELDKACFITVSILNLRTEIVWLETGRLVIKDRAGRILPILGKTYWDSKWQLHNVPARARTAFQWTQLPASRDLHAQEPVGGNITFIPKNGPFSLDLHFYLGANKSQGDVTMRLTGLRCEGRPEG